jgi:hypothetical protein
VATAALAIAAGLLLPVGVLARGASAGGPIPVADLTTGFWLLKATLVLLGVAVIAVGLLAGARPSSSPSQRRATPPSADPRDWIAIAAILAVGAAARLLFLDAELWFDEIDTLVNRVREPFLQMVTSYTSQNHHPLYSLLARTAYLLTGGADWAIRLPAALFGVASLWATFHFGRRVATRAEALCATLLLAVSYHHVWFSQNARGYTGMLFFVVVGTWAILRLVEDDADRPARLVWLYAWSMALATYTHLTASLVVIGHLLSLGMLALGNRRTYSYRRLAWPAAAVVLSGIVALALYSVTLPQVLAEVLRPTAGGASMEWTSPRWLITETLRVISSGIPGGIAVALTALAVMLVGSVSYARQSLPAFLLMTVPIPVTAAATFALEHNLWPRFFFFAAAFIVLIAMRGGFVVARTVFRARGEPVAVAGAVAMALLSTLTLPRAWAPKQRFAEAAAFVESQRRDGDRVVAVDIAGFVYARHQPQREWLATNSLDALLQAERSGGRTFVLYTFLPRLRAVFPDLSQHLLGERYREERVFPATVGAGEIHVLVRDSTMTDD